MQDEENEEVVDEQGAQNRSEPNRTGGLKGKAKEGLKYLRDKLAKTIKEGLKKLWAMLPVHIKLIIIGVVVAIVFIALIVLVIMEHTTAASNDSISSYFTTGEASSTPAGELFAKTGSMLLITDDQVEKLSKSYLADIQKTSSVSYDLFKKKPNNIVKDNSGVGLTNKAISLSADVNIYQHILNSERYNFNRVVWKEYKRDATKYKTPDMTVDKDTRLQFPKDSEKDLTYFSNLLRPYMQSWLIPFTMMSGLTTDASTGNSVNFAYEIISKAYNKIEMEKRIMQSIDITTKYKEYDQTIYEVSITRTCKTVTNPYQEEETYFEYEVKPCSSYQIHRGTCPDDPKKGYQKVLVEKTRIVTKEGKTEICDDSAPKTTVKSKKHIIEDPVETDRKTYNKNVYNYKKLELFDKIVEYTHVYKKYNLKSPADREDKSDEKYYDAESPTLPKIPDNAKSGTYKSTYSVKDGKLYTIVSNWNDSITTTSETKYYTRKDIENTIGKEVYGGEYGYYSDLENKKQLNLVDIMNSNSKNYNKYVKGVNYSENIGYSRNQLQISYRLLTKYLGDTLAKYANSFSYGASLGLKEGMSGAIQGFSLDVLQDLNTNATYVKPIQDPSVMVSDNLVSTNVYGYSGHTGIDLTYPYAKANTSQCGDLSAKTCPTIFGPPVYTVMGGDIYEVGYSAYNMYHNTGVNNSTGKDGNLVISDKTGWGSYVKIKHPDGNFSIYAHLYPDRQFLKELSNKVGQHVDAGTFIGYMGNTGNSSGLHMHFEYANTLAVVGNGAKTLAVLRLAGM